MLKKFFRLFSPGNQYAFAHASKDISRLIIPRDEWITNWPNLALFIPVNSGIISDYMSSIVGGRLCSSKLRKIIEQNVSERDIPIQWLPVEILNKETGETLIYNHLHFPEPADSLKKECCKYFNGSLIAPFFSYEKIKNKQIFNCTEKYQDSMTILSDDIRKAMEEAECTGLNLEPAPVVYDEENVQRTGP